jgi:hypothetical protein
MSGTNEEKQLRLALGQLLRYGHLLGANGRPVRTYIAVEREPKDESWGALCDQLGIRLFWPETFASVLSSEAP